MDEKKETYDVDPSFDYLNDPATRNKLGQIEGDTAPFMNSFYTYYDQEPNKLFSMQNGAVNEALAKEIKENRENLKLMQENVENAEAEEVKQRVYRGRRYQRPIRQFMSAGENNVLPILMVVLLFLLLR